MTFTITTLVENTITTGVLPVIAEHGLSFLIDTGDRKILFDAGQGLAILRNADAMGIDLSEIDTVVLSHGHFDHARGIKKLLIRNTGFTLIAHPGVFDTKMAGNIPIGIPGVKEVLVANGVTVRLESASVEIAPGIRTTGDIPMETDFEMVEPMFFTMEAGKKIPDAIVDDKALILDTQKGIVVILGCAHRGIVNTMNHVAQLTGNSKIYAIIGGLHLFSADHSKLQKIFTFLYDFQVEKMIVGHCTGFQSIAALYNKFGNKVVQNTVGFKIQF